MTDPLRKAAEGLIAEAMDFNDYPYDRLRDDPTYHFKLIKRLADALQPTDTGGEEWTPQIEFNADAGFYEFVSEDVPAVWRPFTPHIEVCVSMKDRGSVIGMRVFVSDGDARLSSTKKEAATYSEPDPLATAINRYAGLGRGKPRT